MRAEVVSIGTELLLGQTVDSNAAEAGRALAALGIDHYHRQTVGDNLARVVGALRLALSRADLVLTIGGLGPTEDDLTREGIAQALDVELVPDESVRRHLRALFRLRGLAWTETQMRQALVPSGGEAILNPNGTAPALWCPAGERLVVALPGPPGEFLPLLRDAVAPRLARLVPGGRLFSRLVRVVGIGEARAEDLLRDLLHGQAYTLAPYAKLGEVHFRASVKAADEATAGRWLDQAERDMRARLGSAVYGVDHTSLESAVLALMRGRSLTLGVAESCTGGMLGAALTSPEGASEVFLGGVVCYSNLVKADLLGVPPQVLDSPEHGAVSEACALAMAEGCRKALGCDVALATTGVAGAAPHAENGVTKQNGLVFVALATPGGPVVRRFQWGGSRETVRGRATQAALTLLYQWLVPE